MQSGTLDDLIAAAFAAGNYRKCLLLVHPNAQLVNAEAVRLGVSRGWERVSIGPEMAAALRDVLPSRRAREAHRWTVQRLGQAASGPVVCTEIDLLFEPRLGTREPFGFDPVALLAQASRVTPLVVAWPGSWSGGVLAYAVPEHDHYRTWRQPDLPVFALS